MTKKKPTPAKKIVKADLERRGYRVDDAERSIHRGRFKQTRDLFGIADLVAVPRQDDPDRRFVAPKILFVQATTKTNESSHRKTLAESETCLDLIAAGATIVLAIVYPESQSVEYQNMRITVNHQKGKKE